MEVSNPWQLPQIIQVMNDHGSMVYYYCNILTSKVTTGVAPLMEPP